MADSSMDDLIREILGEDPELALLGQASLLSPQYGQSFQRFFADNRQRFLNDFNAELGKQLLLGNVYGPSPEEFFTAPYLTREFFGTAPQDRGMGISQFAPRVRRL